MRKFVRHPVYKRLRNLLVEAQPQLLLIVMVSEAHGMKPVVPSNLHDASVYKGQQLMPLPNALDRGWSAGRLGSGRTHTSHIGGRGFQAPVSVPLVPAAVLPAEVAFDPLLCLTAWNSCEAGIFVNGSNDLPTKGARLLQQRFGPGTMGTHHGCRTCRHRCSLDGHASQWFGTCCKAQSIFPDGHRRRAP